jgi:hypothetical protein
MEYLSLKKVLKGRNTIGRGATPGKTIQPNKALKGRNIKGANKLISNGTLPLLPASSRVIRFDWFSNLTNTI